MMKKFIAIAAIAVFMASCGGSSSDGSGNVNADTTTTSSNKAIHPSDSTGDSGVATNAKDSANKMINQAAGKMKAASDKLKDSAK